MSIVRDAQAGAGRVEALDRAPGQEDLAPAGRDDEAGDGRVAVADRDDQVGDLADRLAAGSRTGRPMTWLR